MITKFSVENFLSIRDKVTLDLVAGSNDNSLKDNVFGNGLLKSCVIYGHNASGKTNLLKAFKFFLELILFSHSNSARYRTNRIPYRLNRKYLKKKSSFEIEFLLNNNRYIYMVSLDNERIYSESLYEGRKKIYLREETEKFSYGRKYKSYKSYSQQTLDNMLFISRAVNLKEEGILRDIYLWFKENIIISISDNNGFNLFDNLFDKDETTELMYKNKKLKNKIMNLLKSCDLGIVDIKIKKISEDDMPPDIPRKLRKQILLDRKYKIEFIHEQENEGKNESISFDFNEESSGTQKIFSIAGSIIDALENNKVLLIDELEKSLHPLIMEHIVNIFNSKKNKSSQLIFTTHNTDLLDLNLLRRDQIWFMEKAPNKNTSLVSVYDFKGIRKDLDIKKAYYSGRFGAIPIIIKESN